MASMNRRMNLPQIQKIMMDFERESEFMDMKEEMMNDAIDDAVEEEDDEAETNEIVDRVLDEIGIDMNQQVMYFLGSPVYYFRITHVAHARCSSWMRPLV